MNLYEIDSALMALVDEETGEITDWDAFEALQMEREKKIENVACWYKNLAAEAAAIKAEEDNLKKRREVLTNRADRLKEYLKNALCGEKFQTARCAISWRKTTSVHVSDPSAAIEWAEMHGHKECVTYKAPDINKTELAKILKGDTAVPGAELVAGLSIGVK